MEQDFKYLYEEFKYLPSSVSTQFQLQLTLNSIQPQLKLLSLALLSSNLLWGIFKLKKNNFKRFSQKNISLTPPCHILKTSWTLTLNFLYTSFVLHMHFLNNSSTISRHFLNTSFNLHRQFLNPSWKAPLKLPKLPLYFLFNSLTLPYQYLIISMIFSPGGACTAGGSRSGVSEWVSQWVSQSVANFFLSKRPSL